MRNPRSPLGRATAEVRCEVCWERLAWSRAPSPSRPFDGLLTSASETRDALHFDRERNWTVRHCGEERWIAADEIRARFARAADAMEGPGATARVYV